MRLTLALVASLALVAAVGPSASASGAIHGKGVHAEAALYARVLDVGHRRIQVLDRLCGDPDRQRRCAPMRDALQRAISKAVALPIEWVSHERRHAGTFWVLVPVRWRSSTAAFGFAWIDPGPYGCIGGGQLRYGRDRGAWRLVSGIEYEACSASASSPGGR